MMEYEKKFIEFIMFFKTTMSAWSIARFTGYIVFAIQAQGCARASP